MLRILNAPLPIITAVVMQEIPQPMMTGGPGWAVAVLTGIFIVLWFLNAIGRLPGASGDRRTASFRDEDRARLVKVHEIIVREDPDKPNWPMVWRASKEMRDAHAVLASLAELKDVWIEDRDEWRRERSRMEERIVRLEDTVRRQERALEARG